MSEHILKNEYLTAVVDTFGAQLVSLKGAGGTEYLWCADPAVWGKTSPILFPQIGKVRDSYIKVGEAVFPMTKHGFARNCKFEMIDRTPSTLTCRLFDNDFTHTLYPYAFEFRVIYTLVDKSLDMKFVVRNNSDETMYFALGGHTAFSTEIAGATLNDYELVFDKDCEFETQLVDPRLGLLTGETAKIGKGRVLPLSAHAFNDDAYVFENIKSKSVKLKTHKYDAVIQVDYEDFPNLAVWAMKGTDRFVCIEPWIAQTDSKTTRHTLAKKSGYVKLGAGKEFSATIRTTVIE